MTDPRFCQRRGRDRRDANVEFRRWMRRATVAFAILTVANVAAFHMIVQQRAEGRRLVCHSQNDQNHALRNLIVNGTRASRALEPTLRRLGLPPYAVRLRNAELQARQLPTLNCSTLRPR